MSTFYNDLKEFADDIKRQFDIIINDYSDLVYSPEESHPGVVMIPRGDYCWKELSEEGKQLQSKLNSDYDQFASIVRTLLNKQLDHIRDFFEAYCEDIRPIIVQQSRTSEPSKTSFLKDVIRLIDEQISLLKTIYDSGSRNTIIVPDTNSLVYNPNLEDWEYSDIPKFELILTSTVLEELDKLKMFRNDDVRRKAEGVITRLKGYRTRGRLIDGVPLRKGVSSLRTMALEPDFSATLPWLQSDNNDDRIIASFVEVIRSHLHSEIFLCTRDFNLQNKAEYARLPFIEPPEIPI